MNKLSILIPSLTKRDAHLRRLLDTLISQKTDDIEILVDIDDGEMSVGAKRNRLLDKAKNSQYISFIDDDDMVPIKYISNILTAIQAKPDVVGITGIITEDGANPKKFIHSLKYNSWYESEGIYLRNPNHLNPVKREIALKVKFPEVNNGEDHDYSMRIFPYLKTEVFINEVMYYYLYSHKNTEAQKK